MRFEQVTAWGFGPLTNATLHLGPSMNVVHGPNEAGKSSWHAALYAALCGRRRGAGLRAEERDFRERYRPWSGAPWRASCIVRLEDGRQVEVSQDLERGVDCRALDVTLARDYSGEILLGGAPDGSRWLGLNRDIFPAVACVRQAQILEVLDRATALQEQLQRAAATGGDSTAAAALERIETFQREHVGLDRANVRRPLRLARLRLEAAKDQLASASSQHREWMAFAVEVQELEAKAETAELRARAVQAAEEEDKALALEQRVQKARQILATVKGNVHVGGGNNDELHPSDADADHLDDRLETPDRTRRRRFLIALGIVSILVGVVLTVSGLLSAALLVVVGIGLILVGWRQSTPGVDGSMDRRQTFEKAVDEATRPAVLDAVLGGTSMQTLETDARKARTRATNLADGMDPRMLDIARASDAVEVGHNARSARDDYKTARGKLAERERLLPSVAEAEEELAAAEGELRRVEHLASTLDRTREFLLNAQERVHRDMAPILSESVRRYLPLLTNGRYVDALVDPQSLEVHVRDGGGQLRAAGALSNGTAEQIYLLLRIALAEHLTKPGEVAPLLLDDVTVEADPIRKAAMLELLHAISKERQVILFSQEAAVLDWAEETFGPRDRLTKLAVD